MARCTSQINPSQCSHVINVVMKFKRNSLCGLPSRKISEPAGICPYLTGSWNIPVISSVNPSGRYADFFPGWRPHRCGHIVASVFAVLSRFLVGWKRVECVFFACGNSGRTGVMQPAVLRNGGGVGGGGQWECLSNWLPLNLTFKSTALAPGWLVDWVKRELSNS